MAAAESGTVRRAAAPVGRTVEHGRSRAKTPAAMLRRSPRGGASIARICGPVGSSISHAGPILTGPSCQRKRDHCMIQQTGRPDPTSSFRRMRNPAERGCGPASRVCGNAEGRVTMRGLVQRPNSPAAEIPASGMARRHRSRRDANGGRHRCRPPLHHRFPIRCRKSSGWLGCPPDPKVRGAPACAHLAIPRKSCLILSRRSGQVGLSASPEGNPDCHFSGP